MGTVLKTTSLSLLKDVLGLPLYYTATGNTTKYNCLHNIKYASFYICTRVFSFVHFLTNDMKRMKRAHKNTHTHTLCIKPFFKRLNGVKPSSAKAGSECFLAGCFLASLFFCLWLIYCKLGMLSLREEISLALSSFNAIAIG